MIILIAIVASVALSIPVLFLMWKVFKRAFGLFDSIREDQREMAAEFKKDPFEDLEARVKKMTGPGPNPFDGLK